MLHLTKIAYGAASVDALRRWLESEPDVVMTSTRYLPKRHEELVGGSLYWIHDHALVGRSPLLGFAQREDGRWWIRMEPRLIAVHPQAKRAHQGWRYLADTDAPPDLAPGEKPGDALPGRLIGRLAKLGLV
jgi:hypothetical protein